MQNTASANQSDEVLAALSLGHALPYFLPIAIFPLIAVAAVYGSWWLAGPFVFLWLIDHFEPMFGTDEQNFATDQPERLQFWYKLAVWIWVALYPATFVLAFWQIFIANHLSLWEDVLIVLSLGIMARMALNAGHDMMHRRTVVERRIGEMLMASVSFPQEVTEHIYVHHAHIGTPRDSVSAPKGQSYWQYLPRSVGRSFMDAWRVERQRLARRRLPVWHYTNPIWRYVLETAACYLLAYWIGGTWGILAFACICAIGIAQLRMADYIQHYGLQRVHLPSGQYERVAHRHSWSIAYKLSNWLYYNAQRHADHHTAANRLYPMLRHSGADEAPQLPGSYAEMGVLLMSPKRWFQKMDPLVDQWRTRFYPEIDDWRPYESAAYAARPGAFKTIQQIFAASPRLAEWINADPRVLDSLNSSEFANLDLPGGFSSDSEFESLARRGLARVYWTHELDSAEMLTRIQDIPVRNASEAVDAAREWSNDKVFQLCVHMLRGNLSPLEAGVALTNIVEASVGAVLSAICDDLAVGRGRGRDSSVLALMLEDMPGGRTVFGPGLNIALVYDKVPETLNVRFKEHLAALVQDNLLFDRSRFGAVPVVPCLLGNVKNAMTMIGSSEGLPDLVWMRCVYANRPASKERFESARDEALRDEAVREAVIAQLQHRLEDVAEPNPISLDHASRRLHELQCIARLLRFEHSDEPGIALCDEASVFDIAAQNRTIDDEVAVNMANLLNLCGNLQGILRLLANRDGSVDTSVSAVQAVIAQACQANSFDDLAASAERAARQPVSVIRSLISQGRQADFSHEIV